MSTPSNSGLVSDKKVWTSPKIEDIKTALIKQQEEELLYHVLTSEESFRLLTGSAPSDYRLKANPRDFDALEIVGSIKAYDFRWKGTHQREFGFMAHELQSEIPYLVTGTKDQLDADGEPVIQRVNYAKLTPILLKAIQQQQQQIEVLTKQLKELQSIAKKEIQNI